MCKVDVGVEGAPFILGAQAQGLGCPDPHVKAEGTRVKDHEQPADDAGPDLALEGALEHHLLLLARHAPLQAASGSDSVLRMTVEMLELARSVGMATAVAQIYVVLLANSA